MNRLREILRFIRIHWVHLLILPVLVLPITAIHESAHCAAVLVQGGTITEFSCWPSAGKWGFMNYEFPYSQEYSAFAISMAPYALWTIVATITVVIGIVRRQFPVWLGSTLFIWGFIVPLADIANAAFPYLIKGGENDFRHALGTPTLQLWFATCAATVISIALGFQLQRRLYGDRSLSLAGYSTLTVLFFLGLAVIWGIV